MLYDNPISEIKISLPNLDDYFDSEEFIFDILCRGFQLSIKNITSRAVAIKMKIDSIKVALSVNLPVQERYKNLLSMIPLLIIQGYYLEAQDKLESAGLIFNSDELSL